MLTYSTNRKAKEVAGHRSWKLSREGRGLRCKVPGCHPVDGIEAGQGTQPGGYVSEGKEAGPGLSWAPDVQSWPSNKEDVMKREASQDHVPFKKVYH